MKVYELKAVWAFEKGGAKYLVVRFREKSPGVVVELGYVKIKPEKGPRTTKVPLWVKILFSKYIYLWRINLLSSIKYFFQKAQHGDSMIIKVDEDKGIVEITYNWRPRKKLPEKTHEVFRRRGLF